LNKKHNKANVARKRKPRIQLTATSTFDDYCKAIYDPDRGMFGDTSGWSVERQMKAAVKAGNDKWKEWDHHFVPESEKRRRGRKGWSKAKKKQKAREERLHGSDRENDRELDSKESNVAANVAPGDFTKN